MEAYTDFAQVYDELMDDAPYEAWCELLISLLHKHGLPENDNNVINGRSSECLPTKSDSDVVNCIPRNDNHVVNAALPEKDSSVTKERIADKLAQERNTILDLGCGTGSLTELLARRGYDMIGIDNAPEMLQIALRKRERSGLPILYLLQDMREFELYGAVGAVVSVCDSVNYLLEEEDLVRTFSLVNDYLYPGGLFLFDFNTVYKYAQVIGDATIAENRESCSFIWENYYHEAQEINEYDLTIFVAEGRALDGAQSDSGEVHSAALGVARDGGEGFGAASGKESASAAACGAEEPRFLRFREVHFQRGYRLGQMFNFLERAGLVFLEALDADTRGPVREESERILVAARKGAGTCANQGIVETEMKPARFVSDQRESN